MKNHSRTDPSVYRLSFTFGGLLVPETRAVVTSFAETGSWEETKEKAVEMNLMGKTRTSSVRRYLREIMSRLSQAYEWEINVLSNGSSADSDVASVLFCIVTRYYSVLGDFTEQVVRRRFLDGLRTIDAALFRAFLNDQEPAHPEIAGLADSTREKLTTVAMRTLREAGIIVERRPPYSLQRPAATAHLQQLYCRKGTAGDSMHLLWSDQEIRQCTT